MKVLPLVLAFSSLFMVPLALAQEEPTTFSLSPSDFTIRNAPPLGEPYLLERKLVIRNGDMINRFFLLSVRAPPPENLEPGYEPIPNENWFILIPALIEIEENSDNLVEMVLNIPRWENLTDQRWVAWISVKRMAEPGETIEIELICKAYIETTKELPPPPSHDNEELLLPFAVIIILAVGVAGMAFLLARHRRGEKEFDIVASSAHPRNSSPWEIEVIYPTCTFS